MADIPAQKAIKNLSTEMKAANARGGDIIVKLLEHGYERAGQVRKASDDDLLAIPGFGPAALKTVRKVIGNAA